MPIVLESHTPAPPAAEALWLACGARPRPRRRSTHSCQRLAPTLCRWISTAVSNAVGAAGGSYAMLLLLRAHGEALLTERFGAVLANPAYAKLMGLMKSYGVVGMFGVSTMPLILHPIIVFGVISGEPRLLRMHLAWLPGVLRSAHIALQTIAKALSAPKAALLHECASACPLHQECRTPPSLESSSRAASSNTSSWRGSRRTRRAHCGFSASRPHSLTWLPKHVPTEAPMRRCTYSMEFSRGEIPMRGSLADRSRVVEPARGALRSPPSVSGRPHPLA